MSVVAAEVERPGRWEVIAIVAGCIALLLLLGKFDDAAVREEAAKANAAIAAAERHRRAAEAPGAVADRSGAPRTERLGSHAPMVVPAGGVWGPPPKVHPKAPEPVTPLRRIDGDARYMRDAAEPRVAVAPPTVAGRADRELVLVLLMAGAGLALSGAGARLLVVSRRSA